MGFARPSAVLVALVLALVLAQAAPAADHRVPLGNTDFTIPADSCGFAVDVVVLADKEYLVKSRENADGTVTLRASGQLVLSLTNVDTEKTIIRQVSGPGLVTLGTDASTFISYGPGFTYLNPDEQAATGLPGLIFTYGRFVLPVDENLLATGASLSGRWVDGCALLSD